MATIDELILRLSSLKDRMEEELPLISERAALNAKALIVKRIQNEGVVGEKYKETKLPSTFFEGKGRRKSGNAHLDSYKTTSWKDFRKSQGLQTDYVDATYTGQMWRSLGIIYNERSGNDSVTIKLGGTNDEGHKKLGYMIDMYTKEKILSLKSNELELITEQWADEINHIIESSDI